MNLPFWSGLAKILGWLGGSAVFIAALAWVTKTLFSQSLKTANDRSLEEFKLQLAKLLAEHQIRFSLLHAKRAEVIAALYEQIKVAYAHTSAMAFGVKRTGLAANQQRADAAFEAVRTAVSLLMTRRIWLSEPLASQTEQLLNELQVPSLKYQLFPKGNFTDQEVLDAIEVWKNKEKQFDRLLGEMEAQFSSELNPANRLPATQDAA